MKLVPVVVISGYRRARWLARVEVFYEIRILIRSNVRTALFPSDHGEEQNVAQRTGFRERARVGQNTRAQFKRLVNSESDESACALFEIVNLKPREVRSLRRAGFVVFLIFALATEARTWSRRVRTSAVDIHRILCAILAPMPLVSFAAFNIIYHSYHFLLFFKS